MDREAWRAVIHGVSKIRTRLSDWTELMTLIDLQLLNNPCIPGINPSWSHCMSLVIYCWIQFTNTLLRIFCVSIHHSYWPVILLICSFFVWFCCQDNVGLCFLGILFFYYELFCWEFLYFIINSISLLVISLFRLSISSWLSLRRLYFSWNLSIHVF